MPFSLELPMNTPDWTDVGSGVRENYCLFQIAIQLPNIATLPHQRLSLVFHRRKRIWFTSLVSQRCAVYSPAWLKPVPNGPIV